MTTTELAQAGAALAGLLVTVVWMLRVRAGRDPLGPPATGHFRDLSMPLLVALVAWFAADGLVAMWVQPLRPGPEATQYAVSVGRAIVGVVLLPIVVRRWPASGVPWGRRVVAGLAGGLALIGIVGLVGLGLEAVYSAAGRSIPTQNVVDTARAADGLVVLLPALAAILFAPFAEEVLYRGVLLGTLARTATPTAAITVQALIFGVAHVLRNPALLPLAIPLAVVGWGCGWIAFRTRSLVPAILMHATFNAIQFAFIRAGSPSE